MLKPQINQSHSLQKLLPLHKPFINGGTTNHSSSSAYSPAILHQPTFTKKHNSTLARSTSSVGNIRAVTTPLVIKTTTVIGTITIQPAISYAIGDLRPSSHFATISDLKAGSFSLELVSNHLDLQGNRKTLQAPATYEKSDSSINKYTYTCSFEVPESFGEIGAILVESEYDKKMFFETIALDNGITFTCESWIQPKADVPGKKRIFFTDKSYLPSETPEALKSLRAEDLESLRGNGEGERQPYDRIYDYDVYDDLGDPDTYVSDDQGDPETNLTLARLVLGGEKHPYPRRCRTGRPMSPIDPMAESRPPHTPFYVPCDEDFSEIKDLQFGATFLFNVLHELIPALDAKYTDKDKGFPLFTDIDLLYNQGVDVPTADNDIAARFPKLVKAVDAAHAVIQFPTPETIDRDTFSWFRDEEFCRQMLAGLNPYAIQLVTDWPLTSKLDPEIYGPRESSITKEIALAQNKLFMLDYHDLLLPYVNKTRELKGTTLYGSRTLMFLTPEGTLRPLAIELTRPPSGPSGENPRWNHVYTPTWNATGAWLWKLAKAQVLSHDSAYHELVSHWLRTHCVTEPYIIATNRHLSQMHPIKRLLLPHFRYTMQINSLARSALINAGGVIESTFSPGRYCMQICSDAYDQLWRFDHEALPADLISRGMAVEDPNAPHGVKLTIEDYPFANDGLLIYDAIKQWATSYVNYYYPESDLVASDIELQAWWNEIRTVGHADKSDETWWPQLETQGDLVGILSTIMWVASGHHSAVNFGQYNFGGYFPNRPSIARTKMPNEDPTEDEWESFIKRPEDVLLKCFPSQSQATKVMAVLDVLSSHSPDEEYIGGTIEPAWEAVPAIKVAFEEFQRSLNELESIIDSRNRDPLLLNRRGAGLVPYQLMKPYSGRGVTGNGVPNSISI
ncbi:lipoxygenase 2, chloroplastic-like [Bidens hawaiensis]|uniref:lipoxygenase 2, chloroplastic-like n=1 Tax=Bidens hawaiensis TaxID=980011 RepID=UPI00404A9343